MSSERSPLAHVLFARNRAPRAWKNGSGTTTDVAASPADYLLDDFLWRVSIATVDAPVQLSTYEDVDRWIVPMGRGGIDIAERGRFTRRVRRFAVHEFSTEDGVRLSRVGTPGPVLSLMVRRGVGMGTVRVREVAGRLQVSGDVGTTLVVVLDGTVVTEGGVALAAEDALQLAPAEVAVLGGQAQVAVVRVRPPNFAI
ncbi:HutD family protein [Galbitalea sp. SE-J8]|uniref:HutD/Ves family protein n=1 Tax=Galbitalea sp. SE-J8 TaxID=3054952 RepID=UPI00259CF491|nr:HutD family protein [Galbitalea sp. SE-J8]MDM4763911.1 HutD family protein [Galbitalea sp. SE-J8]